MRPREPTDSSIPLLFDIGQGAGLAGATGVRPFLPPLLAGALAVADLGVDFEGTPYAFLETPVFFGVVLILGLISTVLERRRAGGQPTPRRLELGLVLVATVLGALLFAGTLVDHGYPGWPGLVGGVGCAVLGYAAGAVLFGGARRRLAAGPATLLTAYADALSLVLVVLAVLAPPVSFLALAAFVVLLVRSRRARRGKFEGLRILR